MTTKTSPELDMALSLSTPELIEYLVREHHDRLRETLPAIQSAATHATHRVELRGVATLVTDLMDALLPHFDDEEHHVFPVLAGRRTAPPGFLGELAAMRDEGRVVGSLLDGLTAATDGFEVRAGSPPEQRAFVLSLAQLTRELRAHVALELDVLLPRYATPVTAAA